MLNQFTYDTVQDMHDSCCDALFRGRMGEEYTWTGSSEVGIDNLTLGVRSFAVPNYDLSRLWLTRSRWNTMVRQYVNPEALDMTLGMVTDHLAKSKRKSGTATLRLSATDEELDDPGPEVADLRTNLVQGKHSGRQVRRSWRSAGRRCRSLSRPARRPATRPRDCRRRPKRQPERAGGPSCKC